MNIKERIKSEFGTVVRFAKILGANVATVYSWTKEKGAYNPASWQFEAFMDAATYRSKRVDGWMCKHCGTFSADSGAGIKPNNCMGCGGKYLHPVVVIDETHKKEA